MIDCLHVTAVQKKFMECSRMRKFLILSMKSFYAIRECFKNIANGIFTPTELLSHNLTLLGNLNKVKPDSALFSNHHEQYDSLPILRPYAAR